MASTIDAVDHYEALYAQVIRMGVGEANGRTPLQAALDYAGHVERRAHRERHECRVPAYRPA